MSSEPTSANRPRRRAYTTHDPAVDTRLAAIVGQVEDPRDRQLILEMMITAYRFGSDRASTGDLKIVTSAIKELRYAFKIFRPYRHLRKVAVFGSARVSRSHPAYGEARRFGRLIAAAGWSVITGAASGIMRAGHEGAGLTASFGLNIRLPFEQEANPVIAKDIKLVTCKYFFTRKLLFIKESHATALFPGGFGTLDEGFESLTLVQTGKSDPRPIVFVDQPGGRYWDPLLKFLLRRMPRHRMISPQECALVQVARSAEEAARQILEFYRVYHSQRYVGEVLSIRLQQPLPETAIGRLSHEFRDILSRGEFRQGPALPQEADEPELAHLPRLLFAFNRRSFGRLVQLVHRINALGPRPPR
ncbi:MAG TPA: LOG family protein [bacterium]